MSEIGAGAGIAGEAYRHCEQLVRAHDKDRYLASLYAPAARRPCLFALYAFAIEIGRVRQRVKEPLAGTIRLQWWHEAIAGLRAEEAAASPVLIALQDAARQTGVALTPLTEAVEARQDELHGTPAVGAASAIMTMAARFLGADDVAIVTAAAHAGNAVTFVRDAGTADAAREAYRAFRAQAAVLPEQALPAFLEVSLVPLLLKNPSAPQWRRQLTLLRAAHFGFARL